MQIVEESAVASVESDVKIKRVAAALKRLAEMAHADDSLAMKLQPLVPLARSWRADIAAAVAKAREPAMRHATTGDMSEAPVALHLLQDVVRLADEGLAMVEHYERLVAPPRGAPCPCGSGRKYKRCCLVAPKDGRAKPS